MTLLARQEQSSTITNRVLVLRISFLLLSWNVLKMDRCQSGERLVKSYPSLCYAVDCRTLKAEITPR